MYVCMILGVQPVLPEEQRTEAHGFSAKTAEAASWPSTLHKGIASAHELNVRGGRLIGIVASSCYFGNLIVTNG